MTVRQHYCIDCGSPRAISGRCPPCHDKHEVQPEVEAVFNSVWRQPSVTPGPKATVRDGVYLGLVQGNTVAGPFMFVGLLASGHPALSLLGLACAGVGGWAWKHDFAWRLTP